MGKLWSEIKYWCQAFLIPIHGISFLMPRNKRIWIFGSTFGQRFADNPKYFYLYIRQYQSSEIDAVWISKNKEIIKLLKDNKLKGYYLYSLKGIWYSLRAKVYLYDNYSKDICFTLSGGAVKVNLWHGIPLKKIQKDNIFDYARNPRSRREWFRWMLRRMSDEKSSDYVLTTSKHLIPIFSSAFQTKKVLVTGYPRNDAIWKDKIHVVSSDKEERTLTIVKQQKADKRLLLYLPTFRETEKKFFDIIDGERLKQFLLKENLFLFIKLHLKSKQKEEFAKCASSNIYILDPQEDPYPLLGDMDVLITDYSSIYFDFLLMDKPIVFFDYDLGEYMKSSREMYFPYADLTPGCKVENQEDLERAVLSADHYESERELVKQRVFDFTPGYFGSEDLFHKICRILEKKEVDA